MRKMFGRICKMTVLAALVLMMLLLSACGGDDVGGEIKENDSSGSSVGGEVAGNSGDNDENSENSDTGSDDAVDENPLAVGRMEGGTYTNEYVGIACDLDDTWTFYSAEELQDMPENIADMVAGTELGDALADVQQFIDMKVENVNDMTSVNVLYEKLDMSQRLVYANTSEEQLIDNTLAQSDAMIEAYKQAGIEVSSMEKVKVTFLGEEHFAIKTVSTTQGVGYYMIQIFDYDLGQYAVTMTFASFVEDNTEALLDLFYAI